MYNAEIQNTISAEQIWIIINFVVFSCLNGFIAHITSHFHNN